MYRECKVPICEIQNLYIYYKNKLPYTERMVHHIFLNISNVYIESYSFADMAGILFDMDTNN